MNEDKLMPVLVVEDVPAAVAFYRDVLGFDAGPPLEIADGERFVSVTYGSSVVGLSTGGGLPELASGRGAGFVFLQVPDPAATHRVVSARVSSGTVGPLREVAWGTYFDATDPGGHVVRFIARSDATRRSQES